jgi:uridine kinase
VKISITFPNGDEQEFSRDATISDIIKGSYLAGSKKEIVAARINNEIQSLSYKAVTNSRLSPIFLDSKEGMVLYRRSLCFLLAKAARNVFPDRRLVISHSLGEGYYYYFDGISSLTISEVNILKEELQRIVNEDLPIEYDFISYDEGLNYFGSHNQPHTALLLKFQNDSRIPVYRCDRFIDINHGPLLSRTGHLKNFQIMVYLPGFLLRFPQNSVLEKIPPFKANPILFSIYREYESWGKILNMNSVGRLNELINQGKLYDFIPVAEALHDKKIAQIADMICAKKENIKVVLIAGPSSSGKTTFSQKLNIQLKIFGRNPVVISVDDYFLTREETPLDEEGKPDFEALNAIDIELLNKHMVKLLNGEEINIPKYDFASGKRLASDKKLKLPQRAIIILEGIHCLNDKLTYRISGENKFKIYVSALTQLNLDDHNRISTTDNRLIRRLVRDHKYRGHSVLYTLSTWPSVRRGEDEYIFPFQNTTDVAFNSALDYELSVLKVYANPLLKSITPDEEEYAEARRLLTFLDNFLPIPPTYVPSQSILREFIGQSSFSY